ncbi:DUF389 domain-containing protein [Candidatus Gracilibacteria bacterium]|nr:DUF389 domain-containing protein [Candidatus Gracilibacteria bacterium]MCF7819068.1 DUF389 domain-containing protein [Candidatus Gracilibacteria bacterium]
MHLFRKITAFWNLVRSHHSQAKAIVEFQEQLLHNFTFLFLIFLAGCIASIGLLRENLAVVIGAMIITPLVNPFMGIPLALLTGRWKLFWNSLGKVLSGTALFWGVAFFLGSVLVPIDHQPSMIVAHPIELPEVLIAVFAGMVAALALASAKIYNRISGAAISLALAPPLAISGIGFALGQVNVFWNALTLFAINATGLIVMGFFVFLIFGFQKPDDINPLN